MVKNSLHKKVFVVLSTFLLVGCQNMPTYQLYRTGYPGASASIGIPVGAALGGALGYSLGNTPARKTALMSAGAVAGGLLGYNLMNSYADHSSYPRNAFIQAAEYNPSHRQANWHNPYTDNYGNFMPISTFRQPNGQYCREILETVRINNQLYSNKIAACRIKRDTWQIVSRRGR